MKRKLLLVLIPAVAASAAILWRGASTAQEHHAPVGYEDTPMLPGGKWHVHDGKRPQPRVVTPGTPSTAETPAKPPSDAIVLFDGTDLSKWQSASPAGGPARWKVENGYMEVEPRTGDIRTKEEFGDCQIHLEWREPVPAHGESQERGNSGVFLMGRYEIQVLDSYENITYPDGQAGAVYGQWPPLVNASRPPGEWQTYDIVFTAAHFKDGEAETPAYVTVVQNGLAVQNHSAVMGDTGHRIFPVYKDKSPKGPLRLQDHGNPIRFRNIWLRPLTARDEP